jgi:hypothetical protein
METCAIVACVAAFLGLLPFVLMWKVSLSFAVVHIQYMKGWICIDLPCFSPTALKGSTTSRP